MSYLRSPGKPHFVVPFIALLLTCFAPPPAPAEESAKSDPERGRYLFRIAVSCGCHGDNLAGYKRGNPPTLPDAAPFGERFDGPFGSVPSSNITSDQETGIGGWSDEELITGIRTGVRPDGAPLFPIMPYPSYSGMADQDVRDLVAYLRTVPAVKNEVPAKQLNPPPPGVEPPPLPPLQKAPATAPTSPPERRGEYLALSLAHCNICHSTTAPDMTPLPGHYLAGNVMPVSGELALIPNITPDEKTGIGSWSADDIAAFLKTGSKPNGTIAYGLMKDLIEKYGLKHLTDGDAKAIGLYLKTIPPVKYTPQVPPPPQKE